MTTTEILESVSQWAIPALILLIILSAARKRVPMYESFVTGAKEGFNVAVMIIPYLVAMLFAIKVFMASGIFDDIKYGLTVAMNYVGLGALYGIARPAAAGDDEAAHRRRRARRHARHFSHARAGQLPRQNGLDHDGQQRNDVLHPDGLLRLGAGQESAAHTGRLPVCRCGRHSARPWSSVIWLYGGQ